MFEILLVIFGICFLFGVVYPVICCLIYPIYKWFGGEDNFIDYIKNI